PLRWHALRDQPRHAGAERRRLARSRARQDQQRTAGMRRRRPLLVIELVEPGPLIGLCQYGHRPGEATQRVGRLRASAIAPLHGFLTGYRIAAMEANVRPLRADAARNRARVLDAARTAFAEAGLDVGVEEIARRAGVGKGTLYRRFPTKEALVRAIFEDILDEIERIVDTSESEPDPWAAFAGYLSSTARLQASNQGFYDVVAARLGA